MSSAFGSTGFGRTGGSQAMKTYAQKKNTALAAKNTSVLSIDELERIKGMCSQTNQEQDYRSMRHNERKELQQISQTRVSKWPNTIQAERERKEYERITRLEDDEIARRQVDAEEEAYQQELRQRQLDKTNKMFHDNQDMVKALHSKMLLVDVLAEQDIQREHKKKRELLDTQIGKQWEEMERQKMVEYDERFREKLEKEYRKRMKNADNISTQLEDFKMSFIKRLKEDELEGELIKKQVEEDLGREKLKELERRRKASNRKDEFKVANEQLIKIQAEMAIKEKEEDMRIEEYGKKKEALEHLKREKEAQRFKMKQDIKQALVDRQIQELMKIRDQEEEMLNKQVSEAENKANILFEEKETRRKEMKGAIEKSRKNQIDRKNRETADGKKEEMEFAEFWKLRNEELAIAEQQEREEERQRRVELTNYIKKQAGDKNVKAQEDYINEQHQALHNQALQDQQEKNFYSYAEKCLNEWQSQGKNVKPIIMELKNYKKKVV